MPDIFDRIVDPDNPDLIAVIDDLPLWSAPFGMALLDRVRYGRNMTVLDIGCGLGFPMIELAQRLGSTSTVYGIDPWNAALDRVKQKASKLGIMNIKVIHGKAERLPFTDAFFELVVSNNGLNNVEDLDAVLSECRRVCKSGGQLVATMNLPDTMKEFYDVYRAVLRDLGKDEDIPGIDEHIHAKRKPLEETTAQLTRAGFSIAGIRQDSFTMHFADGTAMLGHFLVGMAFLKPWTDILHPEDVQTVFREIEHRLNTLSQDRGGLILTIPYACIDCRKQ